MIVQQKTGRRTPFAFGILATQALFILFGALASPDAHGAYAGGYKTGRYELIMSKNDVLCKHVQEVLNGDEFADPLFRTVRWTKYGQPSDHSFGYGAEYARFDIDNDSKQELVVRFRSSVNSRAIQRLFVLDSRTDLASLKTVKDLQEKRMWEMNLREGYDFKHLPPLARRDWMEKGKEYYPSLTFFNFFYPFVLNDKTYLLIKDSPDILIDPELSLVALYKGGVVLSADPDKMRDLCYLERKVPNPTIKRY